MKKSIVFKIFSAAVAVVFVVAFSFFLISCGDKNPSQKKRITIWTNIGEFAQIAELFNKNRKNDGAVIVYKENPAISLPPAKDEIPPDIVVGSRLSADGFFKYFKSLDYIFYNRVLNSDIFYKELFEAGQKNDVQFLLPVNFNLPVVAFSAENKDLIPNNYALSLEEIRKIASEYNQKNAKGAFTRIGFSPLRDNDFLYFAAKIFDADFCEKDGKITWNRQNLQNAANELKDWVFTENSSPQTEEDFIFKYLFTPYYRRVVSGRTLFAYTTSDIFFKTPENQNSKIDYRWIVQKKNASAKIPVEDSFVTLGIFKNAKNKNGATEFISWFFQTETQRQILERKKSLNLETELFGILGGFSSVKDVTEYVLPVYYGKLLTNLPPLQSLSVQPQLPARWESFKSQVIEPYLKSAITAEQDEAVLKIEDLESEWRRKIFD